MQPYSLLFVLFVTALVLIHRAVGRSRWRDYQWMVLLAGSMGFSLWCDARSLVFLLITSVTTWQASLRMRTLDAQGDEAAKAVANRKERKAVRQTFQKRRWHVLLGTLLLNFGILGYVKYWNTLLGYVGLDQGFLASRLLLPLGISFYTFTSLGYLIDVYNKKVEPEGSYARYLLFVSWFPQLIQGPINRWAEMREQLSGPREVDGDTTRRALLLIGYGVLKKYALADTLVGAISSCLDHVDYSTPGSAVVMGIVLYSIQQYGDFSGGIDIVEGVSELFGVRMAQNFRQPYFSTSLAEFWRRWHMSLGEWMRAYVFYPLAMRPSMMSLNKWGTKHLGKTVGRTLSACVSNVVVFVLVGLWHGAELHYLLWGLYNGLVIALSDLCRPIFERGREAFHVRDDSMSWRAWGIVRTFALVNLGRYFDRLVDPRILMLAFHNTLFNFRPDKLGFWVTVMQDITNKKMSFGCAAVALTVVCIVDVLHERGDDPSGRFLALPLPVRAAVYLLLVIVINLAVSVTFTGGGFLYANF